MKKENHFQIEISKYTLSLKPMINEYGAAQMKHDHNRPEATEEIIWRDQLGRTYIRTGDIGQFDEDGFLRVHLSSRQNDFHGLGKADQSWQARRNPAHNRNAKAPVEHTEHRILLNDPHVTPNGQCHAARDRVTRNCGNYRLKEYAKPDRQGFTFRIILKVSIH